MKYLLVLAIFLFQGCSDQQKYNDYEREQQEKIDKLHVEYYERDGIYYKYDLINPDDRMKYGFDFDAMMNDRTIRVKHPTYTFQGMGGIYAYVTTDDEIIPLLNNPLPSSY